MAPTFAPSTAAVRDYNGAVDPLPRTPLDTAVAAAVTAAAGRAHVVAPALDPRLSRACAEIAAIMPAEGMIDYAYVEFALQRNGIIEPSPHLLVVWGDVRSPDAIVAQLEPRLPEVFGEGAPARLGVGTAARGADGTSAVVFALQSSGVATGPIPRALPAGGTAPLRATLDPRYHDAEVLVTRDDGSVEHVATTAGASGRDVAATLACGARTGRQEVEISAEGSAGSTVLANFPIWCNAQPPSSLTVEPSPDDADVASADAAEHRLFELANQARAHAGVAALAWDDRLAHAARAYAEEMRRTNNVAHVSPISGAATDRVRTTGIRTAVVLENVARAYSVGEAHTGLMNSPGHRANLLSTSATHAGVGVALGDDVGGHRELFVAQLFVRIPPKIDRDAVVRLVAQRIGAQQPVKTDDKLAAVAQDLASGLAAGRSQDELWKIASGRLESASTVYGRIGSVISAVVETDAIDGKELVGDYRPVAIGVGVAQGPHPELGDGAIWIVALLGEAPASASPGPAPR